MLFSEYYPDYFTATIFEWKHLLKPDKYKDVITGSLKYLAEKNRVKIFAFVIMSSHIHLMWQVQAGNNLPDVQRDFLKFTAQQIKSDLSIHHPLVLEKFKADAKDRMHQFWERNPLSIDLYTSDAFLQKLKYIHWNPVKAGLCSFPEEYQYSSAGFYHTGIDNFGFLTHLNG